MSSLEEQDLCAARRRRVQLSSNEVESEEEYPENDHDSEVPPDVSIGIPEGGFDIFIARNTCLSSHSTCN